MTGLTPKVLLPPQQEVLASGLLDSGFNCILQMPTGSGKTWLAEQAIVKTLKHGNRAVYLTPLRATAAEARTRWESRFSDFRVGVFTGDFGSGKSPYPVRFCDADLLIMTPERLDACTRSWRAHWNWIPEVDLVVIDELHLLAENNRGARLEGAICRFRRLNPFVRFIGLSATLGNISELANWLDGVEYISDWRPISLTWRMVRFQKATEKPDLLLEEVSRNIRLGGQSLIFVQSRRRAEELGRILQTQALRASHHHAGLSHDVRRTIEHKFRGGQLDILIATATLEMGINLPVRQVVLYDLQTFNGTDFVPLSTNSVWQRVGRAGRLGFDTVGEAVLFIPRWDNSGEGYRNGVFEPIRSTLTKPVFLAEQVVAEIASGLSRTEPQLIAAFTQTLAAHEKSLPDVRSTLAKMSAAGMITLVNNDEEAHSSLRVTKLGRIATRHLLNPSTILLFKRATDVCAQLSFLDLLTISAASCDCEPVLPVDFEELEALATSLSNESSFLLQHSRSRIEELLEVEGKRLIAALKMALTMRTWSRSGDLEAVANQFNCYTFEVDRLRESMSRLLVAMASIFEKPEVDEPISVDSPCLSECVKALSAMIITGLDEYGVTLTLVQGIGPRMAKRLTNEGIADVSELADAEVPNLCKIRGVSLKRATKWISEAKQITHSRTALVFRETLVTAEVLCPIAASEVDSYRLRRALDLRVIQLDGNQFLVTGGLEPHRVAIETQRFRCDCGAFRRNHSPKHCKHILAVRLFCEDPDVRRGATNLSDTCRDKGLDLFQLWSHREYSKGRQH